MAKIAFINTLKIPSGEASVNRVLSLAKGLVEIGDEVHIISSNTNKNYSKGEEIDGIKIYNLGFSQNVFGLASALKSIILHIWNGKFDAVISTTNSLLLIYPLAIICKLSGSKFIQEKSEFPFSLMKGGFFNKLYSKFYVNTTYKLMDAMIIMTKPLMEFFKGKTRKKCKFIHIPMTVDPSRFDIPKTESIYGEYIAYCGNMSGNKDGVENLIEAFSYTLKENQNLNLLLIGGTNDNGELLRLKQKAASISTDKIIFYGKAERSEIPQLLKNAKILALARPSSLQSTGGFPTKLGEYLATGNPVVVTSVGDIPSYLNETNSFLVVPNDNASFGATISKIYNDFTAASNIGKNGRELANEVFSYLSQTTKLHNFIISLK